MVISRPNDEQKMSKLKYILRKFVKLPGGRALTFSLEEIGVPHLGDKYKYFEQSLQRSRYKFVYVSGDVSSDSCDADEDGLPWELRQHYALNEMIQNRDSSVVPVTDQRFTRLPTLLDIFRRLNVWKLLRHRSLDDILDVEELSDRDVDRHIVDFVCHMFHPALLQTTPRSLIFIAYSLSLSLSL